MSIEHRLNPGEVYPHLGRAQQIGLGKEAIMQIAKVNNIKVDHIENKIFNIIKDAKLGTIKINLEF
ncbi:MAG: hypothetical protein LBB45_06570 [Methanobrevibacter sp.]|nr:hypothetical protein [Candidatus Methanovirga basalitermitum]